MLQKTVIHVVRQTIRIKVRDERLQIGPLKRLIWSGSIQVLQMALPWVWVGIDKIRLILWLLCLTSSKCYFFLPLLDHKQHVFDHNNFPNPLNPGKNKDKITASLVLDPSLNHSIWYTRIKLCSLPEQKKKVQNYTKKLDKLQIIMLTFHTQLDKMWQQLEKYQWWQW